MPYDMYALIEEYPYEAEDVDRVLWKDALQSVDGKVSVNYVGYFFNPQLRDCVFVLPKVLLDREGLVFGRLRPKDVLCVDKAVDLTEAERQFLYGFSVWIYRAIRVYDETHPANGVIYRRQMPLIGMSRSKKTGTYLDAILALIDFQRKNRDFVFFTAQSRHAGGHAVNWEKTVDRTEVFLTESGPVYTAPITRKKKIDFDEELLVIFFSILEYLRAVYGFPVSPDLNYPLVTGVRFERYLKGWGVMRLKQIRYKYYSDRAVHLWNLCLAFFDKAQGTACSHAHPEYLLAKNFNIVFESIIDELLGDKNIPHGLKEQEDGKRVDHLYLDESLAYAAQGSELVYYIGDSKYYKQGNPVGRESVYKQFTYARNVIQWNLNLFLDGEEGDADESSARRQDRHVYEKFGKLRDDATEGYNIVPNFFVSAFMDKGLSYANDRLVEHAPGKEPIISRQFENRLFDRDTLLLTHYDVNFLFVLALYARNDASQKAAWKRKARAQFRQSIRALLARNYDFYAMAPRTGVSESQALQFLHEDFQRVLGKVYAPYVQDARTPYYSLALSSSKDAKTVQENAAVMARLSKCFVIESCALGRDPSTVLPPERIAASSSGILDDQLTNAVLYGTYHGQKQWKFINEQGLYHMSVEDAARQGIVDAATAAFRRKLFLVPDPRSKIRHTCVLSIASSLGSMTADDLTALGWSQPRAEKYFVWRVAPAAVSNPSPLDARVRCV